MWNRRKTGPAAGQRWLAATALAIVALAVPACSSGSAANPSATASAQVGSTQLPSGQHVSLTLVSYLPLIGKTGGKTLDGLLSGFEAAHPNISVTVQVPSATNGAAITATVQRDEVAGNTPDVVQSGMDMLGYLATGGPGAQDLDRIVTPSALAAEWGGPHPFPPSVRALGLVNGQLYAIPWVLSTPILFYNAKLFSRAGLNPADPPKTWAQVQADALTIKRATGADGLSSCAAGASSVEVDWCTQAMIRSDGGTVLTGTGTSQELAWTSPKTVAAVQELGALGHSGAMVNLSNPQTVQEFDEGKLAMVLNSSAAQASLAAAAGPGVQLMDTGLPSFGAGPSVPTNSGSALAILAKTPQRQQAAWELVQYLTSDSAFATITKQVGYAPLRTSLAGDPQFLPMGSQAQALAEPNLNQLSHIEAWQDYPGPNFAQVEQLLENAVSGVAFQGQPASATLAKAQGEAKSLLGP
ncbi:MAG TPA: extracellular solute-binding protein [Trebonia sp.]|jgi:multiple sugar transport system substrate-binding protein|nr:extracellular solute-binding protein [Trebonia sp.]